MGLGVLIGILLHMVWRAMVHRKREKTQQLGTQEYQKMIKKLKQQGRTEVDPDSDDAESESEEEDDAGFKKNSGPGFVNED